MGSKRKKLRVIVLVDQELMPPDSIKGLSAKQLLPMVNEYDVIATLKAMGHEVLPVGIRDELRVLRQAVEEFSPDVIFNLLVELHGQVLYEPYIVSYLELLRQRYTGCNPRGLMLAQDKALTKQVLSYHRIPVPAFEAFPLTKKPKRSSRRKFPMLVKSLIEDGSTGISQASIVKDDEALTERVEFIHRSTNGPAIAEEYIDGREIYVAVLGNQRLQTLPAWELVIQKLPYGASYIATSKLKWDKAYQKKIGLETKPADVSEEIQKNLEHLSKRIYRSLHLSGYARIDYRLTEDGRLYLLEANPNPDISRKEDLAESAQFSGVKYEDLLQKILNLGLNYRSDRITW